jgi:hypothetical protein
MNIATVDVVLPNICSGAEMGSGILIPTNDMIEPSIIDRIRGFFDSLTATFLIPANFADFFSLYISRAVRDTVTLTTAMKAVEIVANRSPSAGNANVMNGIPKKATLPKIYNSGKDEWKDFRSESGFGYIDKEKCRECEIIHISAQHSFIA